MTDYRAVAMAWVAEPDHRPMVEAAARHLHANESLHLHDVTEGREPCSYCWLRAAKAIQAIERAGQHIVKPLTDEQLAEIRRHDDRVDPDDMTLGDIDRRKLLAEVEQLSEQIRVIRIVGEAEIARAAYEAMDTERRGQESRRAVENVTLAELKQRLKAAEDLCVMYTWSPAHTESPREKAAFELWMRWSELVGEDFLKAEAHPDLDNRVVAQLAAKRDETRARALARIRSDAPTELPGGEGR